MTPTLSVEAFQASETLEDVVAVDRRLPGVLGAVVSPPPLPGVVTLRVLLAAERLPAASRAFTV